MDLQTADVRSIEKEFGSIEKEIGLVHDVEKKAIVSCLVKKMDTY